MSDCRDLTLFLFKIKQNKKLDNSKLTWKERTNTKEKQREEHTQGFHKHRETHRRNYLRNLLFCIGQLDSGDTLHTGT